MESQTRRLRYALIALCFAAVCVCYLDRVTISIAALSMQETLLWSETTKGLVLSSFFVGYLLFQLPAGYLANRFGGKPVLGFAVLWWSLFTILTPWAATISLPVLLAMRIGMGLGEGVMFPAAYNLFAHWVPKVERSRSVSLLMSGIPIGTLCALFLSGRLIARYGWQSAFYTFGSVGFIWFVVWFVCIPQQSPRFDARAAHRSRLWRTVLAQPPVWALVVNHFCSNWTFYMLLAWLPSYFSKTHGLSIASTGVYSAAPWLSMLVTVNVAAWGADRLTQRGVSLTSVRKTMQTTGLLSSAVFLLLAHQASSTMAALGLMCGALGGLGFTWSGFLPNHLDIAPRYADVLMGITNTAGTVPGIIGVAITGWLVDKTGAYGAAFALAAIINLVGALIWLAFATGERILE